MTKTLSIALALATALAASPVFAENKAAATPAAATLAEINSMMGFVPAFIKSVPESLLPGWWEQVKSLEMNPKTALDNRTKELIGLAVAAQIPCDYCVYFHARAAKANGATDQQLQEAIGMAALTRFGSTLMHGAEADLPQYKKDVSRLFKGGK